MKPFSFKNLSFKPILTFCAGEKKTRLFRLCWYRPKEGQYGTSHKLQVSAWPKLFHWQHSYGDTALTLLYLRLHLITSAGNQLDKSPRRRKPKSSKP